MKKTIVALLISTAGMASAGWAQGTAVPVQADTTDTIVRMHEQVQAAQRVYEKKKTAAKRVYDQRVNVAKQERDATIKTARAATPDAPQEAAQGAN
jgi:hypothetical protein